MADGLRGRSGHTVTQRVMEESKAGIEAVIHQNQPAMEFIVSGMIQTIITVIQQGVKVLQDTIF